MGKGNTILGFFMAASLIALPCAAAASPQERESVITVAPAPAKPGAKKPAKPVRRVIAPRDLLGESLGGATASGKVEAPDPSLVPFADRIVPRDAAFRRYGDVGVSVYRAGHEAMASAIVRLSKSDGAAFADVGDGGWSSETETAFWRGPYAAVLAGGAAADREALSAALLDRMGAVTAPAPLLDHLPDAGQIEGSRRYAPTYENFRRIRTDLEADVFGFAAGGAEAVTAEYEQPGGAPFRLTLVEYETPQLAAVAERNFRKWYDTLPPEVKALTIARREGNYLVEATGVRDAAAAQAVVGAVDYAYKIDWLKEPPIPHHFDMAGEGQKVAQVIKSSMGIVGLGVLIALMAGTIVGAEMFRRRRRAVGKAFSDAGGMVCLDLDPALPPTSGTVAMLAERAGGDD
jgi:hypothetical protein